MSKLSRVFSIIGGVFNIFVMLAFLGGAVFCFWVNKNPDFLEHFYNPDEGRLSEENLKTILMFVQIAAYILIYIACFELVVSISSFFIAFTQDSKVFIALVIAFAALGANIFTILGGIFGLLTLRKPKDKEPAEEEPKPQAA